MNTIKAIIFFTIFIFMFSCVKEVDIDVPNKERRIVINSILSPEKPVTIVVNRSIHILDKLEFDTIKKVNVKLFENGKSIESLMKTDNGIFLSYLLQPVQGKTYTIEVTAPDFKTAKSEVTIPIAPRIEKFTVYFGKGEDPYMRECRLLLDDPAEEENFYGIDLYSVNYQMYYVDTLTNERFYYYSDAYVPGPNQVLKYDSTSNYQYISTTQIGVEEYGFSMSGLGGILFSDKFGNGKKIEIVFNSSGTYSYGGDWGGNKPTETYIVRVHAISKQLYEYIIAFDHQRKIRDKANNFNLEMMINRIEPVPVPSNINDGYGIFGAYSTSSQKYIF